MKYLVLLLSLFVLLGAEGCKKGNSESSNNNYWKVKYTFTSTDLNAYYGITYRAPNGNLANIDSIKSGWSYEINYSKDIGLISARSLHMVVGPDNYSLSGDKTTINIYVDGKLVNSATDIDGVEIIYLLH